MRILLVTVAAMIAPASAAAPPPSSPKAEPAPVAARAKPECRTSSLHEASPFKRGDPVRPQKLGELPPATGYKAVLRTINGCDAPLTLVEYQRSSGR